MFSPNQTVTRIVTWAHLKDIDTGIEFFHFNTHFDLLQTEDVPQRSAALVVRKIAEIASGEPVLLTGDFNCYPDSDAYRILTGDLEYMGVTGNLSDPWITLGLPNDGTYHGFTGVAEPGHRIDWILYSDAFSPIEASVIHYNENGRYPSDHFPVKVTFELEQQN